MGKRKQYNIDMTRAGITGSYAQDIYRAISTGVSARIVNYMVKNGAKAYYSTKLADDLHLGEKTVSYNVRQMLAMGLLLRAKIPVDEVDFRKLYVCLNFDLVKTSVEAADKIYEVLNKITGEDYEF